MQLTNILLKASGRTRGTSKLALTASSDGILFKPDVDGIARQVKVTQHAFNGFSK